MNVLLVSPGHPDTFWSFKHVMRFLSKKAAFPPLGLLTVGAMLPREWKLKLIDLNVTRLRDADLEWADYVMVSGHAGARRLRAAGDRPLQRDGQAGHRRRAALHHQL